MQTLDLLEKNFLLRMFIAGKSKPLPPRSHTFISDRGASPYFHGRTEILNNFKDLIQQSIQSKSGTIFLIQGAPGAGKSALLHECLMYAYEHGWKIPEFLSIFDLGNPHAIAQSLGKKFARQNTSVDFLRKGRQPLLLDFDECQMLHHLFHPGLSDDDLKAYTDVVQAIHHGDLNRPVIMIAAGLATSLSAFNTVGISEFSDICPIGLGSLDKDSECAVFYDWFTKYALIEEDPAPWIDAIAQDTEGWPVHMMNYIGNAIKLLDSNHWTMTKEGLNTVIAKGREGREKYYWNRASSIWGLRVIARSFSKVSPHESLSEADIMEPLIEHLGKDTGQKMFREALQQGVFDLREGGYRVPLPHMYKWLISTLKEK